MINVTDLRAGAVFIEKNEPYLVLQYSHTKMGRGNATIRVKARNLKTGSTVERAFPSGNKVEEAEVEHIAAKFLYQDGKNLNFVDNSGAKHSISVEQEPWAGNFLKKDSPVRLTIFEGEPLNVEIPGTVELKVKGTEPGVKGNSATNVYKPAMLESGFTTQVPLFINEGETIKVNTETGKYLSRV